MGKQPPPKLVSKNADSEAEKYFEAKRTVLNFELAWFTKNRQFEKIEDLLFDYGEFLQRHPEAEK